MSEYIVLIAAEDQNGLSLEDEQICMANYGKWAQALGDKHITARRLELSGGQLLTGKKNVTTDGPFAEAKELIAGIILIEAENEAEAIEIAGSCPLKDYFQLFVKQVKD